MPATNGTQPLRSIEQYFDIIHRHTPQTAVIGITTILGTYTATRWYQRQYISKGIADALSVGTKANVYARITPLTKPPEFGRGLEKHAIGSSVLYLDYDAYNNQIEGLATLQAMAKPPTLIVNSGNGLHAYWLLDRFYTDIDAIKARNKGLVDQMHASGIEDADSCYDLARVLRIPETYNVKGVDPRQCSIVAVDTSRVYALTDFEPGLITEDQQIEVWDSAPLPADFLDVMREKDNKLAKRIVSEDGARKQDAATNGDGRIDRSRNDAYIATRMLALGYDPAHIISVLMSPDWFSGAKYRERARFDYVLMTVNNAVRSFQSSADRFFTKTTFIPDKLADELEARGTFVYAGERLWRYHNGAFVGDGEEWIKHEVVKRLGKRWSSRASDDTVRYTIDRSRIAIEKLNQHESLINCANGMLNVDTGDLLPHDPNYLSTAQLPAAFDPNVDTSAIDQFIAQILPVDAIAMFWQYVGSTFLTGRYTPKAFLALVGPRDSGKSKVLELLVRFFGGERNVSALSLQTLADNKFATAALFGKLANIFSDLDEAEAQNVGQIKTLTGGDVLSGEQKFKGFFMFKNTARLFFSANNFPAVRAPDEAYFGRAKIVPCKNVFRGKDADPFIVDKLTTPANLAAILLRAYNGLRQLRTQNYDFTPSLAVEDANNAYRFIADTVSGFLHACEFDATYYIPKQELYGLYVAECTRQNRKPVSEDKFFKRVSDSLQRFGMTEEYKTIQGARVWCYGGRKPPTLVQSLVFPNFASLPAN